MSDAKQTIRLSIDGMRCAACVRKVEAALGGVDGVVQAVVNLVDRTASVQAAEGITVDAMIAAVQGVGFDATPLYGMENLDLMPRHCTAWRMWPSNNVRSISIC